MDEGKNELSGDGFAPVGPFKGRPTFIRSAMRPVDPRISIRIDDLVRSLKRGGLSGGIRISLGIRSLDGFYTNRAESNLLDIRGEGMIDIINFDPVREVFMVSGEGRADISAELLWFGLEAFPDDFILCITQVDGGWPMNIPEKSDDRIEWSLDILRKWKKKRISTIGGYRFYRGGTLDDLQNYLLSEFKPDDQKSQ